MATTSASGWQSRSGSKPEQGTATARPWHEQGYSKHYLWFVARAVFLLAHWAQRLEGRRPRQYESPRVAVSEGHSLDLFELASSYPFIKKAIDISSVRGNAAGPDGLTFYMMFQTPDWCDSEIRKLKHQLRHGTWCPGGLRKCEVPKGADRRLLHIPNLIDRVVERAINLVLNPIVEHTFHPWSFAFRPGMTLCDAIAHLNRTCHGDQRFVLGKLDLKNAFDNVPHDNLLEIIALSVRDPRLFALIERIVRRAQWRNQAQKVNVGLPQGGSLSPLLFNVYLNHLFDQVIGRKCPEVRFLRWADDILFICESKQQLDAHRKEAEKILADAGLPVNIGKTYGSNAADLRTGESIEYLGFRIGMGKDDLTLSLVDSWQSDLTQALLQSLNQTPEAGSKGREQFFQQQVTFTINSWLNAFAGAIPQSDWKSTRKEIKGLFLGNPARIPTRAPGNTVISTPTNKELSQMYDRAWRNWSDRMAAPPRSVMERLLGKGTHRDARAHNFGRQLSPDPIADGADLVPAPSAFIKPYEDRKPGPMEVDWRLELLDVDE